MSDAVLTLQLPKGSRFIPIAMTGNYDCLLYFKRIILHEKQRLLDHASDEIEACIARADLEKLQKVLDLLIQEPSVNEEPNDKDE